MEDNVLKGLPDFEAELDDGPVEGDETAEEALGAEVQSFFTAFVKAARASQLYVHGNPLLHQFLADLQDRLSQLWDRLPTLSVTVHESEIHWQEVCVYREKVSTPDNLAFQLYKDGIRRIEFLPGVEDDELREFMDVLRVGRHLKEDEDDLLTLMWNADFQFIRYEYVDILDDEPPVPQPELPPEGAELPLLPELEVSPEMQTPQLREDFEPSLYFLDEADVALLQQELRREWERPVKRDVMLAVLDQYELGDDERRAEIVSVLRQMLPRVLAEGGFTHASYIVSELKEIANKKGNPEIPEEVEEIIGELSEPIVVDQLVRLLEDGSVDPNSEALATLLGALRPQAIVVLMQAIPGVARKEARDQLITTVERLAAMKPELMVSLIKSDDPRVASLAAGVAGRRQLSQATEAIADLLNRPEQEVRLAAVEALVALRSSVAGSSLLAALSDESRDVRVASARGLAKLKYRPGAEDLEKRLTDKDLRKRDLTEQIAFFEAYARAAGTEGTRVLARMLNGRRFLWLKYPSPVRACAARALGIVGGPEAEVALNKAEGDGDAMVLSAVHAARREPGEVKDGV